MITLDLDWNLWRCGEEDEDKSRTLGDGPTALMQFDSIEPHSCCCIGLMFLAAGAPPVALVGKPTVGALDTECLAGPATDELIDSLLDLDGSDSEVASDAYNLNDGSEHDYYTPSVPERMAALTELFEVNSVATLNWVNVPEDIQAAYLVELTALKENRTPPLHYEIQSI